MIKRFIVAVIAVFATGYTVASAKSNQQVNTAYPVPYVGTITAIAAQYQTPTPRPTFTPMTVRLTDADKEDIAIRVATRVSR